MSISVISSQTVSDIDGFIASGCVRIGGNGDPGSWEAAVIGSSSETASIQWDGTPSDGIDSGWRGAYFNITPGGGTNGVAWTVTGGVTVALSGSSTTFSGISKVSVRAAVAEQGHAFFWRNLTFKFYQNGNLMQLDMHRPGVSVDTRSGTAPFTLERIAECTPGASNYDRVEVTGEFRLITPSTTPPDEHVMRGDVYLFGE